MGLFNNLHLPLPGCQLYYILRQKGQSIKSTLPQVELEAYATILATTSRVTLTQTFENPSSTKGIREATYVFPLHDGVSVVGFTCHVADRTIVGEVKEKEKARQDYQAAIARGETAGLFQQERTADTFRTTVGNVPPSGNVVVKITYLRELKHDMEVDGIRFTLPNIITPRYGIHNSNIFCSESTQIAERGKISITVDVEMEEGSFIQKIISPSHPISVSLGTTSMATNEEPKMTKAHATLGIENAILDADFVLQIVSKNTGIPKALLETHPTMPNQRALMATLVPKFALPSERPEIVFICDRSGSMGGQNIILAKQALHVFLKSLPIGVKFNICSFGSHFDFLWSKSVTYTEETLAQAVHHVNGFEANYNGTEMLQPVKDTFNRRYKDIPLEVMILTDGEIWDQDSLFTYLNEQVQDKKAPARVFSLGVGSSVSSSLVEGIARAGNGFSQTVGQGEQMSSKLVRMLKGALSPHVSDYTLEVKYTSDSNRMDEEEDFEIVEKVADSLTVKLDLSDSAGTETPKQIKPISLFDASVDPDSNPPAQVDSTGQSRYAHLPKLHAPKIVQAPQSIPSLFAFNRTSVYLLIGPNAPNQIPSSVVLRGNSAHGPLELEIPVQVLETPGTTIHQLAVKKAMQELEEGRGWLPEAKDETGHSIKLKHESRFSDIVEREAVRLGVEFQVGGKWCSFVAVEKSKTFKEESHIEKEKDWEFIEDELVAQEASNSGATGHHESPKGSPYSSQSRMHSFYSSQAYVPTSPMLPPQSFGYSPASPGYSPVSPGYSPVSPGYAPRSPRCVSPGSSGTLMASPRYSPTSPRYSPPPPTSPEMGSASNFDSSPPPSMRHLSSTSNQQSAPLSGARFGSASNVTAVASSAFGSPPAPSPTISGGSLFGLPPAPAPMNSGGSLFGSPPAPAPTNSVGSLFGSPPAPAPMSSGSSLFGSPPAPASTNLGGSLFGSSKTANSTTSFSTFGSFGSPPSHGAASAFGQPAGPSQYPTSSFLASPPPPPPDSQAGFGSRPQATGLFVAAPTGAHAPASNFSSTSFVHSHGLNPFRRSSTSNSSSHSGSTAPTSQQTPQSKYSMPMVLSHDARYLTMNHTSPPAARQQQLMTAAPAATSAGYYQSLLGSSSTLSAETPPSKEKTLAILINLQAFNGSWKWSAELFNVLGMSEDRIRHEGLKMGYEGAEWSTVLVILYLETKLDSLRGSWELVCEKAIGWLETVRNERDLEGMMEMGRQLVV